MRETTPTLGPAAAAPEVSDEALVAGTLRGEAAAFEGIMRRYNRRLFRLARSIVRNDVEAEDIVQEAYVRAYVKLAGLSHPRSLGAWLGRIVFNEAISRKRRETRFDSPPAPHGGGEGETWERILSGIGPAVPNPEELTAMEEIRRLIERAVDELPEVYRTVFMMRAVEQMTTAETAAYLEVPEQTVKTRLHRGRQLLQAALSEQIAAATSGAFPFAGRRCDRTVATVLERVGLIQPVGENLQ